MPHGFDSREPAESDLTVRLELEVTGSTGSRGDSRAAALLGTEPAAATDLSSGLCLRRRGSNNLVRGAHTACTRTRT